MEEEPSLLTSTDSELAPEVVSRYELLIKKRRTETLTEEEYIELIGLTELSEKKQSERLEELAELAKLRGVSLSQIMDALGIKPPAVE